MSSNPTPWQQSLIDMAAPDPEATHRRLVSKGADAAADFVAKHFGLKTRAAGIADAPETPETPETPEDDPAIDF